MSGRAQTTAFWSGLVPRSSASHVFLPIVKDVLPYSSSPGDPFQLWRSGSTILNHIWRKAQDTRVPLEAPHLQAGCGWCRFHIPVLPSLFPLAAFALPPPRAGPGAGWGNEASLEPCLTPHFPPEPLPKSVYEDWFLWMEMPFVGQTPYFNICSVDVTIGSSFGGDDRVWHFCSFSFTSSCLFTYLFILVLTYCFVSAR